MYAVKLQSATSSEVKEGEKLKRKKEKKKQKKAAQA